MKAKNKRPASGKVSQNISPKTPPANRTELPIGLKRLLPFFAVLLIVIIGFSVYANSFNGSFIRDDETLIRDNIYVKSWSKAANCFTKDIAAGGMQKWNAYRPLQMLSYMMDYSFWKLNTWGYHLTNTTLHVLTALMIFWLLNILFEDILLSLFTSLLFVTNPLQVEAVSYIAGRADSLSSVFLLLALILYIKLIKKNSALIFGGMLVSYTLAILSKESSLMLPVLVLFYHYTFRNKISSMNFGALLGVSIVYVLIRATLLRSALTNIVYHTTLYERAPGFCVAFFKYLKLLVLPFGLHTEYGLKLFTFDDPQAIFGIILILGSIIYAFMNRDKCRVVFFSIGWFLITLLPDSNLYPVNAFMREHWLYLPSIGFFCILAYIVNTALRDLRTRALVLIAFFLLLVFYSYLTIKQNDYWRDPVHFFQRTLEYRKDNSIDYLNMGNVFRHNGDNVSAMNAYKKVIEIDPSIKEAYNNIGVIYEQSRDFPNAIIYFKKAIQMSPDYANAYNSLGMAYYDSGKMEDALNAFKKASELDPSDPSPFYNMGNVYKSAANAMQAIEAYKKAIDINPNYLEAISNLADVYNSIGEFLKAENLYRSALALDPDYSAAYNNLAVAYYYEKKYALAVMYYKKALALGCKVNPNFTRIMQPYLDKP